MAKLIAQIQLLLAISLAGLKQRRLRAVTTVVGAIGVVAMLVSLLSISEGYQKVVKTTGADAGVRVLMEGASAEISSSIPLDEVALVRRNDAIASDADGKPLLAAERYTTVKLSSQNQTLEVNAPMRGVEAASYILNGIRMVAGRQPESGRRELAVGRLAAQRFDNLGLGEQVKITNSIWTVVGHFESDSGLTESELWADSGALASTTQRADVVQTLLVKLNDGVSVQSFANALDNDPRLHVYAIDQKDYLEKQSGELTGFVNTLGYSITLLMAMGAGFAALGTSYASVSARIREIGTLKALGFRSESIFYAVITESLLLTILGGFIGAVGAWWIFDGLQTSTVLFSNNYTQVAFAFDVSPWILVQAALLAVGIGMAGSLYPAWHVLNIPVSQASAERR
jgi:putative ABC transport system permease protein